MSKFSNKYVVTKAKSKKVKKILSNRMWKCKRSDYFYMKSLLMIHRMTSCVVKLKREEHVEIKLQEIQPSQRVEKIMLKKEFNQKHKEYVMTITSQNCILKLTYSNIKVTYFFIFKFSR